MSLLVNEYLEYLETTLGTGPLETEYKLLTGWVRKPSSEAFGSINRALWLRDSTGALVATVLANDTPLFQFEADNGGDFEIDTASSVSNDTWYHVAVLVPPNTSTAYPRRYINGTAANFFFSGQRSHRLWS